jgi:hypothetical protein
MSAPKEMAALAGDGSIAISPNSVPAFTSLTVRGTTNDEFCILEGSDEAAVVATAAAAAAAFAASGELVKSWTTLGIDRDWNDPLSSDASSVPSSSP